MRFETLEYFIEIERSRSFSEAADRLFISQQGLNKAISSIEDELGLKLVERSNRGVVLTEDGRALLEYAKTIMEDYEAMLDDLGKRRVRQLAQGTERIHLRLTPFVMLTMMPKMMAACEDFFEKTSMQESTVQSAFDAMETAQDNELFLLDLSSDILPLASLADGYRYVPLFQMRLGITWHSPFPLERRVWIDKETVSELPLVAYLDTTTAGIYERIFSEHPLENVLMQTINRNALISWVQAGKAACLSDTFSYYLTSGDNQSFAFSAIDDDFVSNVGFVYRKTRPPSEEALRYMDRYRKLFSETCGSYQRLFVRFSRTSDRLASETAQAG